MLVYLMRRESRLGLERGLSVVEVVSARTRLRGDELRGFLDLCLALDLDLDLVLGLGLVLLSKNAGLMEYLTGVRHCVSYLSIGAWKKEYNGLLDWELGVSFLYVMESLCLSVR